MGKKAKKKEKNSKKKKTSSAKAKENKKNKNKNKKDKKNKARKHLHEMAINYDQEELGMPFSEYLEMEKKNDGELNQIVIDAKLDSDSVTSLTNFLEDNDFSEKEESVSK